MEPRVSFVVPCYNYGHLVGHAIESLLNQTFEAMELIVIDDASSDDSYQVIQQYAADPRVRVIRHGQNKGHIASYNEGFAAARGEFVGLVSADDFAVHADAVARQVAVFDAHPNVGFVYCATAFADGAGQVNWVKRPWDVDHVWSGFDEFAQLIGENYVPASGPLVRRSCHAELGYYDPRLPHTGDWDLWLRLTTRYDAGYIADGLYAYRIHDTNMHHSTVAPRQSNTEHVLTIRRAFDALPPTAPVALSRQRTAALRRAWLRSVAVDCSSGRLRRGWNGLADAVRRSPRLLLAPPFYGAAGKLLVLSVFGHGVYWRLAARRSASRGRTPPATVTTSAVR